MVYALAAFLDDVPLKSTKTLKSGMGNWITQASWPKKKLGASWRGGFGYSISKGDFFRLDITTGCVDHFKSGQLFVSRFFRVELRLVNSERWFHPIFHRKVRPCEFLFLCESYHSYKPQKLAKHHSFETKIHQKTPVHSSADDSAETANHMVSFQGFVNILIYFWRKNSSPVRSYVAVRFGCLVLY